MTSINRCEMLAIPMKIYFKSFFVISEQKFHFHIIKNFLIFSIYSSLTSKSFTSKHIAFEWRNEKTNDARSKYSYHESVCKLVSDWNMLRFMKIVFTPLASSKHFYFMNSSADRPWRKLSSSINFLHLSKQFSLLFHFLHIECPRACSEDDSRGAKGKSFMTSSECDSGHVARLEEVNPSDSYL